MIRLFQGGSAGDFELFGPLFNNDEKNKILNIACQLLARQGNSNAGDFLKKTPFEIYNATNKFNDELRPLKHNYKLSSLGYVGR